MWSEAKLVEASHIRNSESCFTQYLMLLWTHVCTSMVNGDAYGYAVRSPLQTPSPSIPFKILHLDSKLKMLSEFIGCILKSKGLCIFIV